MLKLPHPDSTEYRRATRALQDESINWEEGTKLLTSFLCPSDTVLQAYLAGHWKIDRWLIEGLIRLGETSLEVGGSNVGKTYMTCELMFCVLTGEKFLGRYNTDTGPVLYIGGEGDKDMLIRRMVNVCLYHKMEPSYFFHRYWPKLWLYMPRDYSHKYGAPFSSELFWMHLKDKILSTASECRPRLLVGDPLTALIEDADSNPHAVKTTINHMRHCSKLCDAAFLILHHPKKLQANAPSDRRSLIRGETSWINFVDNVFYLETDEEDRNLILWHTEKSRDSGAADNTGPTLAVQREFGTPRSLPQELLDVAPGVLCEMKHICVNAPPPSTKSSKKGKKGKDKGAQQKSSAVKEQVTIASKQVYLTIKAQNGLRRRDLRKSLGSMDENIFYEAISQLTNSGEIVAHPDGVDTFLFISPANK